MPDNMYDIGMFFYANIAVAKILVWILITVAGVL